MESFDQCRRLEVREKARNVFFVMSLRLSDHKVVITQRRSHLHQVFFNFFAHILDFKFLVLKEFNKTIIPFALVGYETGYIQVVSSVSLQ